MRSRHICVVATLFLLALGGAGQAMRDEQLLTKDLMVGLTTSEQESARDSIAQMKEGERRLFYKAMKACLTVNADKLLQGNMGYEQAIERRIEEVLDRREQARWDKIRSGWSPSEKRVVNMIMLNCALQGSPTSHRESGG